MTDGKLESIPSRFEPLLAQDHDLVKALLKEALDQILQAEMTEFLGAAPGEPSVMRVGSRAGYYKPGLITRPGKIELRVPRDRSGEFSTALFKRFPQSEKVLVSALVEMYMQGVSTHTVKAITEELCNHIFAALTICAISEGLDEAITKFAWRRQTFIMAIGKGLHEGLIKFSRWRQTEDYWWNFDLVIQKPGGAGGD